MLYQICATFASHAKWFSKHALEAEEGSEKFVLYWKKFLCSRVSTGQGYLFV